MVSNDSGIPGDADFMGTATSQIAANLGWARHADVGDTDVVPLRETERATRST